jgi:hypothetical protein
MEVTCSSEALVDFCRTTWHCIPKDRIFYNHGCENPKSYEKIKEQSFACTLNITNLLFCDSCYHGHSRGVQFFIICVPAVRSDPDYISVYLYTTSNVTKWNQVVKHQWVQMVKSEHLEENELALRTWCRSPCVYIHILKASLLFIILLKVYQKSGFLFSGYSDELEDWVSVSSRGKNYSVLPRCHAGSGTHEPTYPMGTVSSVDYFPIRKVAAEWSWPFSSM